MFKTFLRRCFILSKRLFKKPGFVIILLFIPLLVICMNIMAGSGDSGVITIALAKLSPNDRAFAQAVLDGKSWQEIGVERYAFYRLLKKVEKIFRQSATHPPKTLA